MSSEGEAGSPSCTIQSSQSYRARLSRGMYWLTAVAKRSAHHRPVPCWTLGSRRLARP